MRSLGACVQLPPVWRNHAEPRPDRQAHCVISFAHTASSALGSKPRAPLLSNEMLDCCQSRCLAACHAHAGLVCQSASAMQRLHHKQTKLCTGMLRCSALLAAAFAPSEKVQAWSQHTLSLLQPAEAAAEDKPSQAAGTEAALHVGGAAVFLQQARLLSDALLAGETRSQTACVQDAQSPMLGLLQTCIIAVHRLGTSPRGP